MATGVPLSEGAAKRGEQTAERLRPQEPSGKKSHEGAGFVESSTDRDKMEEVKDPQDVPSPATTGTPDKAPLRPQRHACGVLDRYPLRGLIHPAIREVRLILL